MASTVSVKVSGTWRTANSYFVKVGGTWRTGSEFNTRVSGTWEGDVGSGGGTGLPNAATLDLLDFTLPTIGILAAKATIDTGSLDYLDFTLPTIGNQ
tara:strand:+ start:3043 stop:3333 length:291 start_codon:yes stop_codon:yes gene_type:complete